MLCSIIIVVLLPPTPPTPLDNVQDLQRAATVFTVCICLCFPPPSLFCFFISSSSSSSAQPWTGSRPNEESVTCDVCNKKARRREPREAGQSLQCKHNVHTPPFLCRKTNKKKKFILKKKVQSLCFKLLFKSCKIKAFFFWVKCSPAC